MNFKKITAIGTSVLIAGMTMGLAAAATYPAPFVQNGAGDFAVVYGTGAGVSPLDYTNADSLADALSAKVTSTVGLGEEKVQIKAPGNDLTFEEAFGDVKEKLTSTNLPTLFASGKIKDTTGTVDYSQWLELGDHKVTFGDLGGDEDNYKVNTELAATIRPLLYVDQSTGVAWDLVVDFDKAVDFTNIRNGEKLVIAGKEYSVAKDLGTTDDLVLYASSQTVSIPAGSSESVVIDGKTYTIKTEGANTDAATPTAVIYIDGKAESVEEGDTVYSGDQEFYINRIFMQTIPTPAASVEIFAGAQKLTLPYAGGTVEIDGEEVDGVEVAIAKTTNLASVTKLTFSFTPSELDLDTDEALYLEIGETIADPVFGTIGLTFDSASMDLKDEKEVIEFKRVSNNLNLRFTNRNGDEYTFSPLMDDKADDDMDWHTDFYVSTSAAPAALAKNKVVVLQEGSTEASYITRIAKLTSGVSGDELTFKDLSTGTTVVVEDGDRIWTTGAYACNGVVDSNGGTANLVGWHLTTSDACTYNSGTDTGIYSIDDLYTENNAMITLTSDPTADIVVTEKYDEFVPVTMNVGFTADTDDKGEFKIDLTAGDFDASGEDEDGENGYYLTAYGTYAEVDLEDDLIATFYIPSEEVTYDVYVGATAESEAETGDRKSVV